MNDPFKARQLRRSPLDPLPDDPPTNVRDWIAELLAAVGVRLIRQAGWIPAATIPPAVQDARQDDA